MINKEAREARERIARRPLNERRKIYDVAMYFPCIKAGHGSTHNRCVVKSCKDKADHYQNPVEAAEQWLVKNGKISS